MFLGALKTVGNLLGLGHSGADLFLAIRFYIVLSLKCSINTLRIACYGQARKHLV